MNELMQFKLPGALKKYRRLNSSCEEALVSKILLLVYGLEGDLNLDFATSHVQIRLLQYSQSNLHRLPQKLCLFK